MPCFCTAARNAVSSSACQYPRNVPVGESEVVAFFPPFITTATGGGCGDGGVVVVVVVKVVVTRVDLCSLKFVFYNSYSFSFHRIACLK